MMSITLWRMVSAFIVVSRDATVVAFFVLHVVRVVTVVWVGVFADRIAVPKPFVTGDLDGVSVHVKIINARVAIGMATARQAQGHHHKGRRPSFASYSARTVSSALSINMGLNSWGVFISLGARTL